MFAFDSRPAPRFRHGLLFLSLLASSLQAGTIMPGAPDSDGTVVLVVTLPDGSTKTVNVPITKFVPIPPGSTRAPVRTSAADKAAAIFAGLNAAKIPNLGYVGASTVTLPGSVKVSSDDTAEAMTVADLGLSLPGSPAFATLGFDGPLSPTDTDGFESTFTASFGVDGTTFAFASLTYSELATPTADGLASQLYADLLGGLSPSLQPDLHLDLSSDSITFDFAPGSGDYFVEASNTSAGTSQFMNVVVATPEPVTLLLFGAGLTIIGVFRGKPSRK